MRIINLNKKMIISVSILSIITGFIYSTGYYLETYETVFFTDKKLYIMGLIYSLISFAIYLLIWILLNKFSSTNLDNNKKFNKLYNCKDFLFIVTILFVSWLPTLFSIYPGAFSYDAYDEWMQVKNGSISAHHPVIHVLILGGLVELLGNASGNMNLGILVYTLLQMLLLSCVFSLVILHMKRKRIPFPYVLLTIIFFAFSPACSLFSIASTKDVIFTGIELLFFLWCFELIQDPSLLQKNIFIISFSLISLGTLILRNNGLYIGVFTLITLFFAGLFKGIIKKQNLKIPVIKLAIFIFIPYLIYVGPFYKLLNVTPVGVQETLSVPLQQLARVYKYDKNDLSSSEINQLLSFVDEEHLLAYQPALSDPVKTDFDSEYFNAHKIEFIKLWANVGIRHPFTYLNAFLLTTVDGWYPNAVVDGYRYKNGATESDWFDYRVAEPGKEIVYFKKLHNFYNWISKERSSQESPLGFLFLSPGWYVLLSLVVLTYLCSTGKKSIILPSLILIFHLLTTLLGPMMLVRYLLIFYYIWPLLLSFALFPKRWKLN